jgi:hypothetical protein
MLERSSTVLRGSMHFDPVDGSRLVLLHPNGIDHPASLHEMQIHPLSH